MNAGENIYKDVVDKIDKRIFENPGLKPDDLVILMHISEWQELQQHLCSTGRYHAPAGDTFLGVKVETLNINRSHPIKVATKWEWEEAKSDAVERLGIRIADESQTITSDWFDISTDWQRGSIHLGATAPWFLKETEGDE